MSTHVPAHASAAPTAQAPARTAVGTAPAGSTSHPAGPGIQGRQTLLRSVHSEWIKLWTLWSTWISSIITIALSVLFGAGVVVSYGQVEHLQSTAKNYITYGLSFGQIVVAVLGALVITGEYSSGQIRSSLTAVPNRSRLLLSKAVVLSVVAFILGSLSTFLSWAVSKPFIGEHAGSLADTHYLGHIWGSGLTLTGIALMALGFGFLLRSTAGSVTLSVVLLFVITIPLALMSQKLTWAGKILGCLPSTVSEAVNDPFHQAREWGSTTDPTFFLTHGQAIAVFAAWAIVPLLIAWFVFSRRDA